MSNDINIKIENIGKPGENYVTIIDNIKFHKMMFLFNAINNGWTVKKRNKSYIFKQIWKEIFDKIDFNVLYPYNVLQSLIINPMFSLNFPFSKNDIYQIRFPLFAQYNQHDQPRNEEHCNLASVFWAPTTAHEFTYSTIGYQCGRTKES